MKRTLKPPFTPDAVKRKPVLLSALICILLAALGCSRRGEETLSFLDETVSETGQETVPYEKAGEKEAGSREDSASDTKEARKKREIRNPAALVSDPLPMSMCMTANWYAADRCFLADDDAVYYVSGMEGTGKHFLHRIDRDAPEDVYVCGNPVCGHDTEECGAFIGYGSILGYGMDDGVFWYCLDNGQYSDEIRVRAIDTVSGEPVRCSFVIELENIGDLVNRIYAMDMQCIFLKGEIAVVQRTLKREKNAFPGKPNIESNSENCRIELFSLPEKAILPDDDTEILLESKGIIYDDRMDDLYQCGYNVLPDEGGSLYILKSSENPENPGEPFEKWKIEYRYALYRWDRDKRQPETVLESEEASAGAFLPYGNGIRLLLHDGGEATRLVSMSFGGGTAEDIASFDRTQDVLLRLTGDFAVGCDQEVYTAGKVLKYTVFDLSGKEIAVLEPVLKDPRYGNSDKAPVVRTRLQHACEEGLYLSWDNGIILVPYTDEPPVFFGYENSVKK